MAVAVFRLVHTPDRDAFRRTPAGGLLIGRVFSSPNPIARLLDRRGDDPVGTRF